MAPKKTINKVNPIINPIDPNNPTIIINNNLISLLAKDNSYEGVANPPIEDIEQ